MTNAATAMTELLHEQGARLHELETVLQDEQRALVERDMETLQRLLSRKVELLAAVETGERQRASLVASITAESDPVRAMEECLRALPEPGAAREQWTTLLQALERCRAVNEANGTVIAQRQTGVRRTMELLQGGVDPSDAGYTPAADTGPKTGGGREISRA